MKPRLANKLKAVSRQNADLAYRLTNLWTQKRYMSMLGLCSRAIDYADTIALRNALQDLRIALTKIVEGETR